MKLVKQQHQLNVVLILLLANLKNYEQLSNKLNEHVELPKVNCMTLLIVSVK
jgi:hypothetical protein